MKTVYFDTLSILLGIPLLAALTMALPAGVGRLRAGLLAVWAVAEVVAVVITASAALNEGGFAYQGAGGYVGARLVARLPGLGLPVAVEPLTLLLVVAGGLVGAAALLGGAAAHARDEAPRGALALGAVVWASGLAAVMLDQPTHIVGAVAIGGAATACLPLTGADPRRGTSAALRAFVLFLIGDAGLVVALLAWQASLGNATFEALLVGPLDVDGWARLSTGAFAGLAHRTVWFVAGTGLAVAAATRLGVVGFPLSRDLGAAGQLPASMTGLLWGVGAMLPGATLLIRFHPLLTLAPEASDGLVWAALLSSLVAGLLALAGRDLLRLDAHLLAALAAGLVVLVCTPTSIDVAVLAAVTLVGLGGTLPWALAAVARATGRRDPLALGGLEHVLPRLHTSRLLVTAAAAALPPFAGWVVTEQAAEALLLSGRFAGIALALFLLSTFLTALAAWRVLHLVFTGPPPEPQDRPRAAFLPIIPLMFLAFLVSGVFLLLLPGAALRLLPLTIDYEGPLKTLVAPSLAETRGVRLLLATAIVPPSLRPSEFAGLMLGFGGLPWLGSLLFFRHRKGGGPPLGGLRTGPLAPIASPLARLAGRESQVVRSVSEQVERLGRLLAVNLIPAALSTLLQRVPAFVAGVAAWGLRQAQLGGAQRHLFLALVAVAGLAWGLGR